MGLLALVAFLLFPWLVSASTVLIQPLNNTQFAVTDINTNYGLLYQSIGIVASGTIMNGVQVQFSQVNQTWFPPNISINLVEYENESVWDLQGGVNGVGNIVAGNFFNGTQTDGSGFATSSFSYTFKGFPYFYALMIFPSTGSSYNLQSILGTGGLLGSKIYFKNVGGNTTGTTTNSSIYYQIYTGSNATQFFTPDPTFQGFATSSVATLCDNSFATSTGFLDSLGSSFANGICRVGVFLFVPSASSLTAFNQSYTLVQSKVPFSYVVGVQGIYSNLTASTTENLSSVVISFPQFASTSPLGSIVPSTIVGLSTTTISTYLSDTLRQSLLALQRVALWLGFVFFVYRKIIPHHADI